MAFDNTREPSAALQNYHNEAMDATLVEPGVSGTKTNLYGFYCENNDAANDLFVQIFNKTAASVTLGTTVADYTIRIPKGSTLQLNPTRALIHFSTGFTLACTTTRTGLTAPATKPTCTFFFSQS